LWCVSIGPKKQRFDAVLLFQFPFATGKLEGQKCIWKPVAQLRPDDGDLASSMGSQLNHKTWIHTQETDS